MSDVCRNCPICDLPAGAGDRIGQLAVNHYNKARLVRQSYDLTYCGCGELIYISPLPSSWDVNAMYVESEQFTDIPESPYRGEHAIAVLEYITGCLISILRSMSLDTGTRLRVLEVGAGLAWMCRAAKIVNWENVTVAQDLTPEAIAECRWVDHYVVEDLRSGHSVDAHGPFDVVSLSHVFEHLVEPVTMLRRLRGLLSERGFIFITAPCRPSGWQRGADVSAWENWSYNHTPAHIQYFTRGSFERAATAAGLEVAFWSDRHEDGQAFEGWLRHSPDPDPEPAELQPCIDRSS